jgi:hypothetical protein
VQLTDMLFATVGRIFHPPAVPRTAERKCLTVPIHEHIDHQHRQEQVQAVLAKAAEEIAASGLVYKWISYNGMVTLSYWDASQQVFLRGCLVDWQFFFGDNWRVKDTAGREYRGPSAVVTDRLIAAVLAHPATPVASWRVQLQKQREMCIGFKVPTVNCATNDKTKA